MVVFLQEFYISLKWDRAHLQTTSNHRGVDNGAYREAQSIKTSPVLVYASRAFQLSATRRLSGKTNVNTISSRSMYPPNKPQKLQERRASPGIDAVTAAKLNSAIWLNEWLREIGILRSQSHRPL